MQHHNYSLADIEGMLPWERDLYVAMVVEHVEKIKQKREEEAAARKR
jgi:predicted outer membrane lipoprotein